MVVKLKRWDDVYAIGKTLKPDSPLDGIIHFFNSVRTRWLRTLPPETQEEIIILANNHGISLPPGDEKISGITNIEEWVNGWSNPHFLDNIRLHIPKLRRLYQKGKYRSQLTVLPEVCEKQGISLSESALDEILLTRDISIQPLNLTLPQGIRYFIPTEAKKHSPDAFGVKQRDHVFTLRKDGKEYYLATHKPGYATYLVIFGKGAFVYCAIGCANCYRGQETRELTPFKILQTNGESSNAYFLPPNEQVKELVKVSNQPENYGIYDLLLSGGEPLQASNTTLAEILREMENAKHIKSFRICTGALFLGKAARFDDTLISLLVDYRKRTGNSVSIAAHIPHADMITPESIYAALRIRKAGIEIQPQIPLIGGINVFPNEMQGVNVSSMEDIERRYEAALIKSYKALQDVIHKVTFVTGNRPYKLLNDTEGSVPLAFQAMLWELWRRHKGESNITRATSCERFHPDANLDISLPVLLCADTHVEGNSVVMNIPQGGKMFKYREPVFPGINYLIETMHQFYHTVLRDSSIFENATMAPSITTHL